MFLYVLHIDRINYDAQVSFVFTMYLPCSSTCDIVTVSVMRISLQYTSIPQGSYIDSHMVVHQTPHRTQAKETLFSRQLTLGARQ